MSNKTMYMEKLGFVFTHPVVGAVVGANIIEIEAADIDPKFEFSDRSLDGKRIKKIYTDKAKKVTVTVQKGCDTEYLLKRCLKYPSQPGILTWEDTRVDDLPLYGTGSDVSVLQESDQRTDDNAVFEFWCLNYQDTV